jgi:hypothetical protein
MLLFLYVFVDDTLKLLEPALQRRLLPRSPRGRKADLTPAEVVTLELFRIWLHTTTVKDFHRDIRENYQGEFPGLPAYNTYIENRQSVLVLVIGMVKLLVQQNRQATPMPLPMVADVLPIAVCDNHRISTNRVFQGLAKRGKTTMGWFYGFKLHVCIDAQGKLLSIRLTPGNTADVTMMESLLAGLKGIAVMDKGYISKALQEKFGRQGLLVLTPTRKNMKKLMAAWQHACLKQRQKIESLFSLLDYRSNVRWSLLRSPVAAVVQLFSILLVYSLTH